MSKKQLNGSPKINLSKQNTVQRTKKYNELDFISDSESDSQEETTQQNTPKHKQQILQKMPRQTTNLKKWLNYDKRFYKVQN